MNREQRISAVKSRITIHPPEPFRIRVIEPIDRISPLERERALNESGLNTLLLDSKDVYIDCLTDSGTGAVTQSMQAAMLKGDDAYSGSKSFRKLESAVEDIFDYKLTIPTHQGRGAEQLYVPTLIDFREKNYGLERSKMTVISNFFFDTTQAHSQINGCNIVNAPIDDAFDTNKLACFKGDLDLDMLQTTIESVGAEHIPYIVMTITCNSIGGQPVSMANMQQVYAIAREHEIPVVIDCARFAENAYFIQQRELGYEYHSIEEITKEMFQYGDLFSMSAKKDAMVPIGGILSFRNHEYFDVFRDCQNLCVVLEGFPTYGGLEGGAMERLAVGLYEAMRQEWLEYRIGQVRYLVEGLRGIGVECQQPGGHAAFVNAGKLLPHIPPEQFPGVALANELYLVAGIRTPEIGSLLLGRDHKTGEQLPCPAELLRITIPRATYTQSHMDYIIEAFRIVKENVGSIKGVRFTYEPPVLRHFNARFAYVD
ncbi:tryptophanase [Vibrio ouci]|uniref:Tryptophanase n=1 Tax=Vibrio ouci TaxID=2499078 RepID=A0A4Y8WJL7_9VIBR|nr:tryptophanase [Vibrio ouci]TFH92478.1 tryptophanase [Vibrio ouci]